MSEIKENYNAGRKEPFYKLEQEDKVCVLELLSAMKKIGLDNVNFEQYSSNTGGHVNFYLDEYKTFYQLVVKTNKGTTDIYKIGESQEIEYQSSEED